MGDIDHYRNTLKNLALDTDNQKVLKIVLIQVDTNMAAKYVYNDGTFASHFLVYQFGRLNQFLYNQITEVLLHVKWHETIFLHLVNRRGLLTIWGLGSPLLLMIMTWFNLNPSKGK